MVVETSEDESGKAVSDIAHRTARAAELARLMPELQARARRAARTPEDAEDLAQEALLRVWARLKILDDIDGIDGYLMVTLRHLARARKRRHADALEADELPARDASAEAWHFANEVMSAVERLPRDEARMISAMAFNGMGYADDARVVDLPLGTLMSRRRHRRREELGMAELAPHPFRPKNSDGDT